MLVKIGSEGAGGSVQCLGRGEGVTPFEAQGAVTISQNGGVHGVLTLAKLPITSDEPQR